jgi:putative transposase
LFIAIRNSKEADKAFDKTLKLYQDKYPKAMGCLEKDRSEMLEFYNFPAIHWTHIRTTNPIESTFATVRLRTKRSRNCGSRETTLAMVFKLLESAQKRWSRIKGFDRLAEVIRGVEFIDGESAKDRENKIAA